MISQQREKKLEISQAKWIKHSDETSIDYENQETTANLREIRSYVDGAFLTFYIRIYHDPDAIKTKTLISQLEKQYNERVAEIEISNKSKKNDWVKPEKMDANSKDYCNRHFPTLKVTEKEYRGQLTQIGLATFDKRFIGEFIYIINYLFDIKEIYDDLFTSFKIKPLFDDISTIKSMVSRNEYKEAIESALETSQYKVYETTHYDLGKYFENMGNIDCALNIYKKIPKKNSCFSSAQQSINQIMTEKKLENEKHFQESKHDIEENIQSIKVGLTEILAPYLSIKKINSSMNRLVNLSKDIHATLYLEDKKGTNQLELDISDVIQEI
ncbi:MAG: hypothetical protein JO131_03465, partial [Gammaproteobacteria bacterium]|nr:hypothetical protein [Gammaproteobacteria bacterium]